MSDKTRGDVVAEAIRRAIEAIRHQAGQQPIDQMTALHWLSKKTTEVLRELKEATRATALLQLKEGKKVPLTGHLGTTQVTFQRPAVKLVEGTNVDQLRELLGDRFEDFFKVVPERVEPVNTFMDLLDEYDGPKAIRDLLDGSISYSERPARVNPPRPPKV